MHTSGVIIVSLSGVPDRPRIFGGASKIATRYLVPYLDGLGRERAQCHPTVTEQGLLADAADPRTAVAVSVAST